MKDKDKIKTPVEIRSQRCTVSCTEIQLLRKSAEALMLYNTSDSLEIVDFLLPVVGYSNNAKDLFLRELTSSGWVVKPPRKHHSHWRVSAPFVYSQNDTLD
jgi:tRNA splicing endonuclease